MRALRQYNYNLELILIDRFEIAENTYSEIHSHERINETFDRKITPQTLEYFEEHLRKTNNQECRIANYWLLEILKDD